MPNLKWIVPEGRPLAFPIYKTITTVGRAATNDVTITEPSVSDFHAQLVFDGRDFNLSEADGDGTIQVNGKKKRRTKIFHNDRLLLGDVELTFSIYDEVAENKAGDPAGAELAGMVKLSEFNRKLLEIRSVPDQIRALLDAVIDVTSAAKGFVILLENGEPRVAAARNVEGTDVERDTTHLSDSIIQQCIESRQPLIVSDALNDTMFKTSKSVMNLKLCSVMVAPLISQGQILGLIYVGNDNVVSLFEESSLDVLTIFAGQASLILQNAILLDELQLDKKRMEAALDDRRFGDIIGSCPSLLDVFSKVEKIAGTDISVLITGETGTGKELIARELHRRSGRVKGPFVVVNCGAIPENLMESELFGHVRGAFTGAIATRTGKFQQANNGTLFLDEIGEMPLSLQVKLLRALQERIVVKVGDSKSEKVDIRIVAATNRNLEEEIRESRFREDLFYRLNVVNLHLPPLRERGDDVTVIAKYLLQKHAGEYGVNVKGFTPGAMAAMRKYTWPGNVRQLENRIKKALVLADKTLVGPEDIDLSVDSLPSIAPLAEAREDFTRKYILDVLEQNNGNRTKTARDLGVDPRTVFRYLEREPDAPEPGG
ncbi:MAG: transcriptional regulator with GAF, ATPase, and Fis domain [Polyangiales bacterium]|jgi:transcriptional regulator with GAF, ATPase, and Fis domain